MNEPGNTKKQLPLLWLRAETKPFEQRTLLTPSIAALLVKHGYEVVVERSPQRIFDDHEYESVGCRLVNTNAWQDAPPAAIVLGLKELDPKDGPFTRVHVHFAHVFKEQLGWQDTLEQFRLGGGVLYDLEYLTDIEGKRLAAFGYWAGFVGAAVAVLAWCAKQQGNRLASLSSWPDKDALVTCVRTELANACNSNFSGVDVSDSKLSDVDLANVDLAGVNLPDADLADVSLPDVDLPDAPNALIIGALGRCGSGAVELLSLCGIESSCWDQAETASGGPFDAVRDHDILINCVFVSEALPPFTTLEDLQLPDRRLQVISDVSCDPFGQYNPLPIYNRCTSMDQPVDEILPSQVAQASLHLIAIDHLPSLLPRESSEDFAHQLASTLLDINQRDTGAWQRARSIFSHHLAQLPETIK